MNLTGRQRDFLGRFLSLYRESREALHYTAVAQRLGLSKITAYDMLRLLEDRGLTQSEYVLRGKGRGAGRSSIVFRPTPRANALFAELGGQEGDREEWKSIEARILKALRAEKTSDYQDVIEELLARLPSRQSPLLYAAEMITAIILSLQQLREEAVAGGTPLDRLRSLGIPNAAGLSALGGLAVGLSFVERLNRRLIGRLLSCEARYLEIIAGLSGENRNRLANFTQEVMRIVER